MKGLKIDKDNMLDTDGVEYENYSATFNGKKVVVRVSIEIERHWETVEIQEEVTS